MLKSTRVQMALVLVVGAGLGYGAGSGRLGWSPKGAAAPSGAAAGERPADAGPQGGPGAVGRTEKAGKQPNIVFIMGDDIGWYNIGAYHQGIMSGKTPNID